METKKRNILHKLKGFFVWVLGNTIWTIITLIIPFSLLIPLFSTIKHNIIYKTYTIKVYHILLFIIFILIEFIIFSYSLKVKKKNKEIPKVQVNNNNNSDNDDNDKEINEYGNSDYYFEDYHKHLTVYKNGNGIIINSFTLVINNINSVSQFKRELNIKDAKQDTNFPKLRIMKKNDLKNRFNDFCFKCKCINNDSLIHSIEERYWTNDSDIGDDASQADPKILKWILKMNLSSVEIGKPYKIVYVISIPGMFPIENGIFNNNIANQKNTNGKFSSQFVVGHKMKKFTYTISFENGLKLYKTPIGKISNPNKNKTLHFITDDNIIYKKYTFSAEHLNKGCSIDIEWFFKNISKQKGGKKHANNKP